MKRPLFSVVLLVVVAVGFTARAEKLPAADQPRQPAARAGPVTDYDYASLLANLRASGASVKRGEALEQPFFSVKGRMIILHGEEVQVFQYPDAKTADAQAALVSPSGTTIGTTKVFWIGPPHFYKKGKILALYIGENDKVLKALEAALGRPFAGGSN